MVGNHCAAHVHFQCKVIFLDFLIMYHMVALAVITAFLLVILLIAVLGGVFRGDVISLGDQCGPGNRSTVALW